MNGSLRLWPERASDWADKVDVLNAVLNLHNFLFALLVFVLVMTFAIKYRRRSETDRPTPIYGSKPVEYGVIVFGMVLWLGFFFWAADLYFDYGTPPSNAIEVYVTGRQWMFHLQHPGGQREINELHVPLGRPVRLTMTSEDVIHSFFVPAFRLKRDLVPGRYSNIWFNANKTGKYHLFCAEYCGTEHSHMGGWVYVMDPAAYEAWLSGTQSGGGMDSMASQGQKLFAQYGCSSCHRVDMPGRGPNLTGLYGIRVLLSDGSEVAADDSYLRESILNPSAKIAAGFQNIMPAFQGQLTEQNVLQLIVYIRSLGIPANGTNVGSGGEAGGISQDQMNRTLPAGRPVQDRSTQDRTMTTRP
jgi:cytochrome c oxidase subunit 2